MAAAWRSKRFRVPPPTTWIVSIRLAANSSHMPRTWRNFMAMLSRRSSTAPSSCGTLWPVFGEIADRPGMFSGARKWATSGLMKETSGFAGRKPVENPPRSRSAHLGSTRGGIPARATGR